MPKTSRSSEASLWQQFWFAEAYTDSLGSFRLFFSLVVLMKLTGAHGLYRLGHLSCEFPRRGIFEVSELLNTWCMPYPWLGWLPVPTEYWYARIEEMMLILSISMLLGFQTRVTTRLLTALFTYIFLLSELNFHHHSFCMLITLWILSFSAAGDKYSIDAILRSDRNIHRRDSILPLRFLQTLVVVVYSFTFFSKLRLGWFTGQVMTVYDRMGLWELGLATQFPPQLRSLTTLFIEGFIPVALCIPRLRHFGIFAGILLHLAIDISVNVGTYSYQMMALYIAFIHPGSGATVVVYDPSSAICQRLRRWSSVLDWLRRTTWISIDERKLISTLRPSLHRRSISQMLVITPDGNAFQGALAYGKLFGSWPLTFVLSFLLNVPPLNWFLARINPKKNKRRRSKVRRQTNSNFDEPAPFEVTLRLAIKRQRR